MDKISGMRVESPDLPLKEPFKIALGTQYNAPNVIVFVETETDVVGLGEGSLNHYVTSETQGATLDTISKVSELLVGRDVVNYRATIKDLHATFLSAALPLFVLETAIIGTCYQEIDIPTAELFGESLDIVETDMTISIHTPDAAAKRAELAVQNGFGTLKTKIGEDFEADIQRVRSVSKAAPDATIIVDTSQEQSVSEAIMFDQAMHDAGISLSLLEQPVVKSSIAGLASVRNRTRVPVDADEVVLTPEDAVRIVRNDVTDVINIKLGRSRLLGVTDIAAITRAAGRNLMVGYMLRSSASIHTNAHLVSDIGGLSHVDPDATRLLDDNATGRESGPTTTPSDPGHGIAPN